MSRFAYGVRKQALTAVGAWCFFALSALAQDQAIPKPKAKAAPAAPKSTSKQSEPSGGGTLLVLCDLPCSWKLDGTSKGSLAADSSSIVRVVLGQHIVSATTQDGRDRFETELTLKNTEQTIVRIQLEPIRTKRFKHDQEVDRGVWRDSETGLIWTKNDNGDKSNLTWQEAVSYCKNLQLADHLDWRLPTLDELLGIYDPAVTIPFHCCDDLASSGQTDTGWSGVWHVKGGLHLTGSQWSSTSGQLHPSSEAWVFSFTDRGAGVVVPFGSSRGKRALCVRNSKE